MWGLTDDNESFSFTYLIKMAKEFYKDKWGWIGGILFFLNLGFKETGQGSGFPFGSQSYWSFNKLIDYIFRDEPFVAVIFVIVGFVIGLGIHKLFLKSKWVKR